MAITRPSTLSDDDRNAIIEAMKSHGAQMTVSDPRIDQFRAWVLSAVGAGVLALGGYLVHSVDTLNQTMMRYITIQEYSSKALDAHMQEINDHEIRLTKLETQRK